MLKTVCKVHAPDYWDKALKVSHNQANNGSEINYIVKWFKAHNLALIGKHILICLFLPKTMPSTIV